MLKYFKYAIPALLIGGFVYAQSVAPSGGSSSSFYLDGGAIASSNVAAGYVDAGTLRVASSAYLPAGFTASPSTTQGYRISTTELEIAAAAGGQVRIGDVNGHYFRGTSDGINLNVGNNPASHSITVGYTDGSASAGNVTINKVSGRVKIAAGNQSLTVTNNVWTSSMMVFVQVVTDDATAKSAIPIAGSGAFDIKLNAAATGDVVIDFFMIRRG